MNENKRWLKFHYFLKRYSGFWFLKTWKKWILYLLPSEAPNSVTNGSTFARLVSNESQRLVLLSWLTRMISNFSFLNCLTFELVLPFFRNTLYCMLNVEWLKCHIFHFIRLFLHIVDYNSSNFCTKSSRHSIRNVFPLVF